MIEATNVSLNLDLLENTITGWQKKIRGQFQDETPIPETLEPFLKKLESAVVHLGRNKTFEGFDLLIPPDLTEPIITVLCGAEKYEHFQENPHCASETIGIPELAVVKMVNPENPDQPVFFLSGPRLEG